MIQDHSGKNLGGGASTTADRLAQVGRELADGFSAVVDALSDTEPRPIALARRLGINKDASSRLLRAIRQPDPLAVAYQIPGPDPLHRMLDAAETAQVSREVIERARRAVARFADLIDREAGDRAALETMIAGWFPEARAGHELEAKQTAFRGMQRIKGLSVGLNLTAVLLRKSEKPNFLDFAVVYGAFGLRRFNERAELQFASWVSDMPEHPPRLGLDGRPAADPNAMLLRKYCRPHDISLAAGGTGANVQYTVRPADVGRSASVDVVSGELQLASMMMVKPPNVPGEGRAFVTAEVSAPCETLVLDVLLPHDVYPGEEPQLHLLDTGVRGVGNPNDPAREGDRLDLLEQVHSCGVGVTGLRLGELPVYTELLADACRQLDVSPTDLRTYRTRIEFPVYASQVSLMFRRPAQ